MKKFLLGLVALGAVFLPLSQNAQAHWVVYRKVYVYRHVYVHHRCWHHGYFTGTGWEVVPIDQPSQAWNEPYQVQRTDIFLVGPNS
jgi:hypothetical protein